MKHLIIIAVCILGYAIHGMCEDPKMVKDTTMVILENDQLKVTEYVSNPGNDVCGAGKHSHPAHLSIMLTDASVILTTADGKTEDVNLKAGTVFWSEPETHMVVNNGDKPVKVYLVELKN